MRHLVWLAVLFGVLGTLVSAQGGSLTMCQGKNNTIAECCSDSCVLVLCPPEGNSTVASTPVCKDPPSFNNITCNNTCPASAALPATSIAPPEGPTVAPVEPTAVANTTNATAPTTTTATGPTPTTPTVTSTSTPTNRSTNGTGSTPATTLISSVPANRSSSVTVTTATTTSTAAPVITTTAKVVLTPGGGGFSISSFVGGIALVSVIVLVAFVIYKLKRAKRVQNPYSQF